MFVAEFLRFNRRGLWVAGGWAAGFTLVPAIAALDLKEKSLIGLFQSTYSLMPWFSLFPAVAVVAVSAYLSLVAGVKHRGAQVGVLGAVWWPLSYIRLPCRMIFSSF